MVPSSIYRYLCNVVNCLLGRTSTELKSLETQCWKLEKENDSIALENEQLKKKNEELELLQACQSDQMETLDQKVKVLTRENSELITRNQKLQNELSEKESVISDLKKKTSAKERELTDRIKELELKLKQLKSAKQSEQGTTDNQDQPIVETHLQPHHAQDTTRELSAPGKKKDSQVEIQREDNHSSRSPNSRQTGQSRKPKPLGEIDGTQKTLKNSILQSMDSSDESKNLLELQALAEDLMTTSNQLLTGDRGNQYYSTELDVGAEDAITPSVQPITGERHHSDDSEELDASVVDAVSCAFQPGFGGRGNPLYSKELDVGMHDKVVPGSQPVTGEKGNPYYIRILDSSVKDDVTSTSDERSLEDDISEREDGVRKTNEDKAESEELKESD